jgi:7,8-dihydro-6-hydroxymethylpterin-pyrophosphokinase
VGYSKQSPFWNMAAAIATDETPEKIRTWLAALEKKAGRIKKGKNFGPRTLDVDLIVWKDLVESSKNFELPHTDIASKAFVLFPMLEIAPQWTSPLSGKPIVELAAEFKDKTQIIGQLPADTFMDFPPHSIRK